MPAGRGHWSCYCPGRRDWQHAAAGREPGTISQDATKGRQNGRGYAHFQFSDYAKLTVIGVVIACVGWPVVTRITSAPRWLFLRLAVLVTVVRWLPDLYILHGGAPATAVAALATSPPFTASTSPVTYGRCHESTRHRPG
jgi:hypothetical protein